MMTTVFRRFLPPRDYWGRLAAAMVLAAGLSVTMGLGGCSDDDAGQTAAPKPAAPKQKAAPKPKQNKDDKAEEVMWSYDPEGGRKRNPFQPFSRGGQTCLDKFDLFQLRVKGVTYTGRGGNFDRAMIQCPGGRTEIAKMGDPIGSHHGVITNIMVGKIEVTEKFIDERGVERDLVREMRVQ